LIPTPIGVGRAYHPGPGAVTGSAIHGMRCIPGSLQRFGVHVEFFADRQVVLLLFAIWGRQLGTQRLLGFHGEVRVYLGGRRVFGDPQAVPLKRHAEIVLEVGGYVPPHRVYLFPRGV